MWAHEAHEFTPWLLTNIGELAEALGSDLEEASSEAPVGDFAVEIVAQTWGGRSDGQAYAEAVRLCRG